MPYTVILTGTIASGKSTAADFFKQQGIAIISADEISRELTAPNTPTLAAIATHFGQDILTPDGTLDRRALRTQIIHHIDERKWLEAYLHPKIRTRIAALRLKTSKPYVVIEVPLLKRREDFPYLDTVLLLEIDELTQIKRLMDRDHCSEKEAKKMIAMQPTKTTRRNLADNVVQNTDDIMQFKTTLKALHTHYLKTAQAT